MTASTPANGRTSPTAAKAANGSTPANGAAAPRILVVGGGFAGLSAAANAADEIATHGGAATVTLVSDSDHMTIRPRLYEPDPETLRAPIRPVLDALGIAFVEGTARRIDTTARTVSVASVAAGENGGDGAETVLGYDRLILATGSRMPDLPVPGVAEHSFNIDGYAGAVALDRHLRETFATPRTPPAPGDDTVVIVGGGMTGIELAAEMRNRIACHAGDETAAAARVVLVEMADAIGPEFGDGPRPVIAEALAGAGVELRLGRGVAAIDAGSVTLSDGERLPAATAVVTVGLRASALTADIPGARDALGRLCVDDDLRVAGLPEVYATGDVARARVDDAGNVALMSCQHARTMGKYAGYNAARDLMGLPPRVYRQPDYTTCLDLGSFGAVFTTGWERTVQAAGPEAKKRKVMINTQWIYPPTGSAEAMRAALRIDERGR